MNHDTPTRIHDIKGSTGSHPGNEEILCGKLGLASERLYRKYLATPILAFIVMLMLRYLGLFTVVIPIRRWEPSLSAAYPYCVIQQVVHDCRFAVFRRRAVCSDLESRGEAARLSRNGRPLSDYQTRFLTPIHTKMRNIKNILAAMTLLAVALTTVYPFYPTDAPEIATKDARMTSYEYIGQPDDPNWHAPTNWNQVSQLTNCGPGLNICGAVTAEDLETFLEDRSHLSYEEAAELDEIENKL